MSLFCNGLHRLLSALLFVTCCAGFVTLAHADDTAVTTNKLVKRFIQLDTNGDGVSFEEFMRMIESRARREYAQMDANHDGRVTKSEYRRFWNARKAQYYRVKR